MTVSVDRQKQDDRGGRRRVKDRRFQVAVPPDTEKRTNWKRRSGLDPRCRSNEQERSETTTEP